MVAQDVDVINHSVSWVWQGPGDGTSPYSNAVFVGVNVAIASGATWVNSAGNDAQSTWFSSFTDTDSDGLHNFSAGDECNSVMNPSSGEFIIEAGEKFNAQLRWDDVWFGANRDLDLRLYLVDSSGLSTSLVAESEDEQSGGQRDIPRELLSYTPTSTGTYCLAVRHYSGAVPSWIQLQARGNYRLEHHTIHHSIGNPAESANPGLLAVGATHYDGINTIASYSSQGPAPDGRIKPDIVGVAGGQSVSRRSADRPNGRWYGTSQASPHVAGLAALVKQNNPGYTPQQVANYLKTHAEERGAAGRDNVWGSGFAKLPAPATGQPTPTPTSVTGGTPAPTPTLTATPVSGQTPVPTPTLTATPVSGQVPPEVLIRISTLERLVAGLQGMIASLQSAITALDGRVTALETGASVPTPTATSAPGAPTPTPSATPEPTATHVPGAPTPTPSATAEPTATPIPDPCRIDIPASSSLPVTLKGSWTQECFYPLSPERIQELTRIQVPAGNRYYKYTGFEVTAAGSGAWTATLESTDRDTVLFLWKSDEDNEQRVFVAADDDILPPINTNSRVSWTPTEGMVYYLDMTTYDAYDSDPQKKEPGEFTLTIESGSASGQGSSSVQGVAPYNISFEGRR